VSSAADSDLGRQPAATAGPFRRVLVAWDGSADSVAALQTATALVGQSRGHVVALAIQPAVPYLEAADDHQAELSAQARRLEATFEAARESVARNSSARVDLHTAEGRHVADSICAYAQEHGFDLLVVGRHGDGGLIHAKLGHIAESAVRSCRIPVLLVSSG
jgi:nucleotide-binding universal stress UspA family protein